MSLLEPQLNEDQTPNLHPDVTQIEQPRSQKAKVKVANELIVMQPGEKVISVITRHPIGIIAIYAMIIVILIVVAAAVFVIGPSLVTNQSSRDNITQAGSIVFLISLIVFAVFGAVAHVVYWGNKWIVTSDSITQISRYSLFFRESSQLGMNHIEDVTAEQNGIFPHIFNYGTLKAETAGERSKFVLLFCPNPNFYATAILDAREEHELDMHGQQRITQPADSSAQQAYPQPTAPQQSPPDQQNPLY